VQVRREVVVSVCAAAAEVPSAVPAALLRAAAERMRDKRPAVRREAIKAFAGLYAAASRTRAAWVWSRLSLGWGVRRWR
jgi:hypothetical protein